MMNKFSCRTILGFAWFAGLFVFAGLPLTVQAQAPMPASREGIEVPLLVNDPLENLQEMSLKGSILHPIAPVPGGQMETAEFTRDLFQMQWRKNDPMDVFVIRPKGVARPPLAIYLYGFPVEEGRFRNDTFCKLVTQGGVAVIGFVPALTAERYHDIPMKKWFVSELHDSIVKTVHDVQMIINYAEARGDFDTSRIGIFGQGSGATIAGLAASVDPRITAIDLMDPWGDWPDWYAHSKLVPQAERDEYLKPDFLKALVPLDPLQWAPKLDGKALKVDDVMYDSVTPADAKAKIEAVLPSSVRLVRYKSPEEFQENALKDGKLITWIREQLTHRPGMAETKEAMQGTGSKSSENAVQSRDIH